MSADQPCGKLRITESFQESSLQDGRKHFALNVDPDKRPERRTIPYHDVLSKESHDEFHDRYALENKEDLQGNANRIAEAVNSYCESFSRELLLDGLLTSDTFQMDIEASYPDNAAIEDRINIDGIPWELLEPSEEPNDLPPTLSVRRVLPISYIASDALQKEPTWHWDETDAPAVNLLLVVARKIPIREDESYDDCDPGIAQQILMSIKAALKKHGLGFELNINILLSPRFVELKDHLDNVEEIHGKGYYDIIHFDAHGVVKKDKASLQLSADFFSNRLETVGALELRACIAAHGSKCVVFNSCDSARADRGQEANLSRALTQLGVPMVLGMSSSLSETAAAVFLKRFYEALFIKRWKFSQAATSGRIALRRSLKRHVGTESFDLADSNVPVCYTTGQDIQIPSSRNGSSSVTSPSSKNASSLWCIPWKTTSPTDSRIGYTTNIPHLEDEYAYMGHDDGSMLHLDDDVMRFHRDLQLRQIVFLCGGPDMMLTKFVRSLCKHWRSTRGFSKLRYIRAEEFSSSDFALPSKKKDCRSLWKRFLLSMDPRPEIGYHEEQTGCSDLKEILIIDRIHLLDNDRGRANLKSYLSLHPLALSQKHSKETTSRYNVIIIGQHGENRLREVLPGLEKMPQFFKFRSEPRYSNLNDIPDDPNEAEEVMEGIDDVTDGANHVEGALEEASV